MTSGSSDPPSGDQSSGTSQRSYDEVPALSRIGMRPTPFWKTKPDLWFVQMEAQFLTANITVDVIKYNYVIQCLDDTSLTEVNDIVLNPPATDKYATLKNRLGNSFADSAERKLHKLLNEVDLGDRRPSQLLRRMRDLAQNGVSKEVLRSLWLHHLPQQIQVILTATKYDLEELSQLVDRVTDVLPIGNNTVATFTPNQATSMDSQCLRCWIEKLETRLLCRKSHVSSDRRRRSRSRSKSKNRLCWYRRRFGGNATKCTQPCGWKTAVLEN
ncbi:PREDICTED: uncharacterized protein LOC108774490 [Cyphomyrmex costatus]|uniref:DUF7041 domain-containing protein n=1 Tax=Cyphomyrmex costatus TaxID=456900 RepID=A0A151IIJ9_9HYME|nr:PREDICTED: uncharacterized protein LOC108774490 [Cyphomyrmex costatus]KYN02153.1 hypothetical protein ALC62_07039 [Cyphomyrmex costatus]